MGPLGAFTVIPILGKPINFKDYTQAQVQAHWLPWFGTPGHIKIGYNSADVATCDAQCAAMKAQGIVGVNADYYGPDSPSALACLHMLAACERAGLNFSLCIDEGAVAKLIGPAATAEYIRILKFAQEAFFSSPAYLMDSGRAVVNFFNEAPGVNWTQVRAGITQKLAMIWQGGSGFTHAEADGSFGWVNPVANFSDSNLAAVQTFISGAMASPAKLAFYPIYTGFDDTLASWGKGRYMSRRGGRTMLDVLGQIPKTAKYAMISTFNDYEEGTAIELSQG